MIFIFLLIMLLILSDYLRRKFRAQTLGWKVDSPYHDTFRYYQMVDKEWKYIDIERGYDAGSFHPVFKDSESWKEYPNWAQNIDEIMQRVSLRYPRKVKQEIDDIGSHLKNK